MDDAACSDVGFRSSMGIPPSCTAAGEEMEVHLVKLRLRTVDRTRTYFLDVMKELRRPKTHSCPVEVSVFGGFIVGGESEDSCEN